MFKQEHTDEVEKVEVTLDGEQRTLRSGVSVAAALLSEGILTTRTSPSSGKPCAPHCLMGVCFECLMEINGVQRQACVVQVESGMDIRRRLSQPEDSTP